MSEDEKFLTVAAVAQATSLSVSTIRRMEARGAFPKSVLIGARRRGWRAGDVRDFIKTRGGV